MRQNDFIKMVSDYFSLRDDRDLAVDIANAMFDASTTGRGNIGSFVHDGVVYYIESSWYDGCLSGDCNPATCYTKWSITPDLTTTA